MPTDELEQMTPEELAAAIDEWIALLESETQAK